MSLRARFETIRDATLRLAAPLSADDCQAQSHPDASPVKWHLAHTTWFFETFVLGRRGGLNGALFNSYYASLGEPLPRASRALLTRPSLDDVLRYRREIDREVCRTPDVDAALVELGLQHEQQHQELILTDLKHLLWMNPARPAYVKRAAEARDVDASPAAWMEFPGGLVEIGADGSGFAFDHERPRHRRFLEPFALASRPVTCGEYLEFMRDGGYTRPELWLSDGWDAVRREGWTSPLYWEDGRLFTLAGPRPLDPLEPVCHVSAYEADAYARWAGARLPGEDEWEVAAERARLPRGTFLESGRLHPAPGPAARLLGDVWEWTRSAYGPYPGYRAPDGELGEYNGKFMSGRLVLRGGSCATPESHVSATYRNYFPPDTRWQFTGIRLAK
ncbi:MAG TPA: ergothioneine biosynthesis protein EgtB [Planctomycetota bacterium]